MTRQRLFATALTTIAMIAQCAFAGEITPISLKPFATNAPFDAVKADWLLPRGRHVFDGVPWQIDGTVLLNADSYAQRAKPAPVAVRDISVGQKFDALHVLAAAQASI